MTEPKEARRAQLGLKARFTEISNYLSERYVLLFPGKTRNHFVTEIYHHVSMLDDPTVDDSRNLLNLILKSDDPMVPLEQQPYDPILSVILSAVYLLRAIDAETQGQHEQSWNYLADATYWCGLAQGGKHVALVQAAARKNLAVNAVGKRHEGSRKTKEFAQQLARDLRPDGGWKSRIAAAREIKVKVVQFAKSLDWTMTADRVPVLIDQWLSQMPDANQIFPTQRKKNQSTQ